MYKQCRTMEMEEDRNGDYVILQGCEGPPQVHEEFVHSNSNLRNGRPLWWWGTVIVLGIFLVGLVVVFIEWVAPFFINKEVIPIIDWEMETFSTPVQAVIIFASLAIFPAVFLPSTPSMWVAGMNFGYGIGFLLVITGLTVGVSLPYFIGFLFHQKIQGWLEKHPKKASTLRLASEGNWFHQFRAITLIRISPFPYVLCNYAVVATNVKYSPYLLGSLVGLVPEVFVALYSGILIKTMADATQDPKAISTPQKIFNAVGFCATVAATVTIGIYAKRRLDQLPKEEELLLE